MNVIVQARMSRLVHCDTVEALPLKQLWPVKLSQVEDLPQHSMVRVLCKAEHLPGML